LATKVAKMYGGGTPAKMVTPGPLAGDTSKMSVARKGTTITPTSTQCTTDRLVADERKGAQTRRFRRTLAMLTKSFISVRS
jgi:hypothetical protein